MRKLNRRQFYVEVFVKILNIFFFAKIRMRFKHRYSKDKFIYHMVHHAISCPSFTGPQPSVNLFARSILRSRYIVKTT